MLESKQIFSIRKTLLGAGSVLLGMSLISTIAHAEELPNKDVITLEENVKSTDNLSNTEINPEVGTAASVTTEAILSPIRYERDDTKEVGFSEIKVQGQPGKIIYTTINDQTTFQRIEPTETVIVLGTKPIIDEKIEKATTEYVLDETREFGDNTVVNQAVDGVVKTETNYRIAPLPSKDTDPSVLDETYRYIDEQFYSIDNTKSLPSDKIVIDKLFVDKKGELSSEKYEILPESAREKAIGDMIQINPGNSYVSELVNPEKFDKDKQDIYMKLLKASYYDILNASKLMYLNWPINMDNSIKNYYSSNEFSEGFYADLKADAARLKLAKDYLTSINYTDEELMKKADLAQEMFDILTTRYNSSRGIIDTKIDYHNTSITDEDKQWLDETIQSLPKELRKNLPYIYLTDEPLPKGGKAEDAAGQSFNDRRRINVRYLMPYERKMIVKNKETGLEELQTVQVKDRRSLLRVLLHELSHNIDFNSGSHSLLGFSGNSEFREVYNKYIKNSVVSDYYRNNPEEAFAEGFARYLRKYLFNVSDVHYRKFEDQYYGVREGEEGYEEAIKSPFEDTQYYFAKLYNRLFEQPVEQHVVIDTVSKSSIPLQNGKVILGAKPTQKTVSLPYNTMYKADDSKVYGDNSETGGIEGSHTIGITYSLENNVLKPIETVINEIAPVDKVITKGTKSHVEKVNIIDILTKYINNDNLELGQQQVSQEGQRGYTVLTTNYQLNSETGEITSHTKQEVVPMIERIVQLGTKKKVEENKVPEVTQPVEVAKPTEEMKQEFVVPTDKHEVKQPEITQPIEVVKPTEEMKQEFVAPTDKHEVKQPEITQPIEVVKPTEEMKQEFVVPTDKHEVKKPEITQPIEVVKPTEEMKQEFVMPVDKHEVKQPKMAKPLANHQTTVLESTNNVAVDHKMVKVMDDKVSQVSTTQAPLGRVVKALPNTGVATKDNLLIEVGLISTALAMIKFRHKKYNK